MLKPLQSFGRDEALDLWTSTKAKPEKLPFLWSRHRTLRLIDSELELLCDESRDALHHPLPRPLAANVDITVIRISNETMTPALQLPVEFVEHEVTEQWRKWSPLRSPFHARAAFQEELVTQALSEYDLFVVPDATTALSSSRRELVRKYQDTIQNAYLPRPPQAPATHFKRLYRK